MQTPLALFAIVVLVVLCQARVWPMGQSAHLNPNEAHHHHHQHQKRHNHHDHHHHHHHHHHHQRQPAQTSTTRQRHTRATYLATGLNLTSYQNDQPVLDQCCACDEAKYEMVFEGLWSRYTHPDEFPENYWLAQFSYIIGASHSNEFRMWSEDQLASEGVKELAESGNTKKLEAELKQASSKTRTIIKARELQYPTLNSKTSAVFRTDRQHHLVSILSKLSPSPDWMVGVSALELCQTDCSWTQQRVVNLYLWDAGTDSGTTFTAPNSPSRPQEKIHPFRRSPNGNNYIMQLQNQQPITTTTATTTTTTTRRPVLGASYLYQDSYRPFSSPSETQTPTTEEPQAGYPNTNDQQNQPSGGGGGSYSNSKPFARLTVTRQRIYEKSCNGEPPAPIQPNGRHNMANSSSSSSSSFGPTTNNKYYGDAQILGWPTAEPPRQGYADCRFTDWSDWSTCSSTCGKGIRTRTRAFLDEHAHLADCSEISLIEKMVCLSECVGNTTCVTRDWSEWSKCSVSCGQGYRRRTRAPIGPMKKACESVELAQMELCTGPQAPGSDGCPPPQPTAADCEVTEWSRWSECSVACGKGTRIRTRRYKRKENVENCSARLIQKQTCTGPRPELCKQQPGANNNNNNNKDLPDRCTKPKDNGPCLASFQRWHFDKSSGMCKTFQFGGCLGNNNNFDSFQDCERSCMMLPMSSSWSSNADLFSSATSDIDTLVVSASLGNHHHRQQQQQQQAQQQQQHHHQNHHRQKPLDPNLPVIDCKLSAWSPWSTCSALCGPQAKRTRSRYIIQMPQNGGKPCDKKLSRSQKCKNLPPCPSSEDDEDDLS